MGIFTEGKWHMTTSARQILEFFDLLPAKEKTVVASEIIRRTAGFDLPELSDEDLVLCAEDVFLELDRQESDERDFDLIPGLERH